ncbi:MAG: 4-alpha-glucanotransferase [Dehalococcoidia bacterium]
MSLLETRSSGVLLHVTSLPGPFGSGDLGAEAFRFIDLLATAGVRTWQVLPLNPPGPGFSPYFALSSFAGNPSLISPASLAPGAGPYAVGGDAQKADFEAAHRLRDHALRAAFATLDSAANAELDEFSVRHNWWLDDWTLFATLERRYGSPWQTWPREFASRARAALARARMEFAPEIRYHQFVQQCFEQQWHAVRSYATDAGLSILGDLPIFPALHSSDVWAHQHVFKLGPSGYPDVVGGVPPDYFSETGQRWGTPLYRWDVEAGGGYAYWRARLRRMFELYDTLRIDHFRGFAAAWEIPAAEPTAIRGQWVTGPGKSFFDAVAKEVPLGSIVAEDLGLITPDVIELRDSLAFPGMLVLQFAFDSGATNLYLPHNHVPGAVVYTGTHDNDTTRGWWDQQPDVVRDNVAEYVGYAPADPVAALVRAAFMSVARLAIVPMQDLLGLGSEARMNLPGTAEGNWAWRFRWDQVSEGLADELRSLLVRYGRATA